MTTLWPDPSQPALMFRVALIFSGDGTVIVTTQLVAPDSDSARTLTVNLPESPTSQPITVTFG